MEWLDILLEETYHAFFSPPRLGPDEGTTQQYAGMRVAIQCFAFVWVMVFAALSVWVWKQFIRAVFWLYCEKVLGHDFSAWTTDRSKRGECRRCGMKKLKRRLSE